MGNFVGVASLVRSQMIRLDSSHLRTVRAFEEKKERSPPLVHTLQMSLGKNNN